MKVVESEARKDEKPFPLPHLGLFRFAAAVLAQFEPGPRETFFNQKKKETKKQTRKEKTSQTRERIKRPSQFFETLKIVLRFEICHIMSKVLHLDVNTYILFKHFSSMLLFATRVELL